MIFFADSSRNELATYVECKNTYCVNLCAHHSHLLAEGDTEPVHTEHKSQESMLCT